MAESSSQPREMKGPARLRGRSGAKARDAKKTAKRLLGYLRPYRWRLSAIMLFLIINAAAGAAGSMFLQILIDDYIEPLLLTASPVFTGLLRAISIMACIYLSGILSNFLMQRLMIKVSQGVLRDVRDQMFSKLQRFPLRYFDSNSHGDIMSHYTNDTDTLRQFISQTIPQLCSSAITVVVNCTPFVRQYGIYY